jgi:hypothetical protein
MNESEIIVGDFYWVWIDPSHRHTPNLPPVLIVAQPWRTYPTVLMWEGCGTDEGVRVLSIVARVAPPERVLELERALIKACDHATTHLPEDREVILECRRIATGGA